MRLADVCTFKPPKKEARQLLNPGDLVSFVPMNNLGIRKKALELGEDRPLEEVAGSYTYFSDGDVLLAKITPCFENGKLGIASGLTNGVGFGSSEFIVMRPTEELDAEYLFYFLSQDSFLKSGASVMSGAVGHKRVPKEFIEQLEFPLPSRDEQRRIVNILDEAFEGIDSVVANTEKNLANSREIFDSYLNLIFSQMDKESLGHKLENMCERITKGSSPKWQGIEYVDNPGVLFVTSENVGKNRMVFNKNKYVDLAFNKKDSKSILKNGDVLTNIVGASIGRTSVFDRNDLANINQAVCLIRCDPGKLVNLYLSYLLNSPFFRKILHENEIDNARANLSLGFFKNLSIPVPNIEMQLEIVEGAKSLEVECDRLGFIYQQKLTALAELKQSLLHKAFSGELTAKGAEAAVEEATV